MVLLAKPFVFMRHGETPYNKAGLMGGITDTSLSALGRQQAAEAAKLLQRRWSFVATSALSRSQETAALAVPGQPQSVIRELGERNWGDLEGCPIMLPMIYEQTPINGESWEEFQGRVLLGLNNVLAKHSVPLIVAHSGVYRVLCNVIKGTPYGQRSANATPYLFSPVAQGWEITLYKGFINEE